MLSAAGRCWLAVKAVTKKLFADGYARHADVCAGLGLSDNGGHLGPGRAPGTFT